MTARPHVPGGASRGAPRGAPRGGFTLVELIVAITLLAVVLGAVVGLAVAQQRTHAALAARRAARTQARDAALVLARELRPLVTTPGDDPADLHEASDTALELTAATGGAVACAVPSPLTIAIPAPAPDDDATLAWWTAPPDPGDHALVYDEGIDPTGADDRWIAYTIADVGTGAAACAGSAFAPDPAGLRLALAGAPPLPPTVRAGTPVRLARRRRWTHYRAGDGAWYLGLREWDGSAWRETQPVAGPLRAGAGAGLGVRALDPAGSPLAPGTGDGAAALRLVLRAGVRIGWAPGPAPSLPESAVVHVAPRGTARGVP